MVAAIGKTEIEAGNATGVGEIGTGIAAPVGEKVTGTVIMRPVAPGTVPVK